MPNRQEYAQCVGSHMKGKKLSKEERKLEFCIAAKTCSGKTKTREEAETICSRPKLPKWAKQNIENQAPSLSCDERMTRTAENIDAIALQLKTGEVAEVKSVAAQVLDDLIKCRAADKELIALAEMSMSDINTLSKRHYLKGEAKDTINQLKAIKEIIG